METNCFCCYGDKETSRVEIKTKENGITHHYLCPSCMHKIVETFLAVSTTEIHSIFSGLLDLHYKDKKI